MWIRLVQEGLPERDRGEVPEPAESEWPANLNKKEMREAAGISSPANGTMAYRPLAAAM